VLTACGSRLGLAAGRAPTSRSDLRREVRVRLPWWSRLLGRRCGGCGGWWVGGGSVEGVVGSGEAWWLCGPVLMGASGEVRRGLL
jgi:hypothetical protein